MLAALLSMRPTIGTPPAAVVRTGSPVMQTRYTPTILGEADRKAVQFASQRTGMPSWYQRDATSRAAGRGNRPAAEIGDAWDAVAGNGGTAEAAMIACRHTDECA